MKIMFARNIAFRPCGREGCMNCFFCHQEWDPERGGLICPHCKQQNLLPPEERKAICLRALACERNRRQEEAFRLYTLLAASHDPDGGEGYGRCFEYGIGTGRDLSRAATAYFLAAEDGSDHAAYRLARLLLNKPALQSGNGTPLFWACAAAAFCVDEASYLLYRFGRRLGIQDEERFYRLREAALAGNRSALRRLGHAYRFGLYTEKNAARALYCYRKLPRTGLLFRWLHRELTPERPELLPLPDYADFLLSLGEEAGKIGAPAVGLRLFLLAAEEGSAEAAYRAAVCYRDGNGIGRDLDEAVRLFELAGSRGSAEAELMLGRLYEGELNDRTSAALHYEKAAESGRPEYAYIVGDFYLSDAQEDGVRCAVPWLRRAAEGGVLDARRRLSEIEGSLSDIYNRALDAQLAGDMRRAYELYKSAAALGHPGALCNLGYCLQRGLGCTGDAASAAAAYREAAAAGNIPARLNLGLCYLRGEGIRRDFRLARQYLSDLPDPYAKEAEAALAGMEERRKAKRAARLYTAAAAAFFRGDVGEALRLRVRAAEGGDARAAYVIGCHFEFGDGVAMDREKADRFYDGAASAGYGGSHARLKSGYLRVRRRLLP